jgi:hypothetical protein
MGAGEVRRQQPTGLEIVDFEVVLRHRFQIASIHTQDENDFPPPTVSCMIQIAQEAGDILPPDDILGTLYSA